MALIVTINFLIYLILSISDAVREQTNVTVTCAAGTFVGEIRKLKTFDKTLHVRAFLGIPYAEPPVGKLRFQKPVMKNKLEGTFIATGVPPACLQLTLDLKGIRKGSSRKFANDCLFLNIYTPEPMEEGDTYPVMVWFHGGGFVIGMSDLYPADFLSAYGKVIVVSVNYRLGIFGFLSTGDSNLPGNYGLWDQHMAIRWIHDNIASFGGDPNKLTIFGNSAGGASVVFQGMYPENIGMVSRIISQSGSITCPWAFQKNPLKNSKRLARLVGCETEVDIATLAKCLKGVSDERFMDVYNDPSNKFRKFPLEFVVSVDGEFVPLLPWELMHSSSDIAVQRRNVLRNFDLMAGLVEDEGFLMISPFAGVDNSDTYTVNRTRFENVLVAEIVHVLYGENIPESVRQAIIAEYTAWHDPENMEKTFDSFMRLSSDYVFNSHTVDLMKRHGASYPDKRNRFLYLLTAMPSQHLLWVPTSWKGGPVHCDELTFIFGYDSSEFGFTANTHPYGESPDQWEIEMSKYFITMWTNFAKSGDPNTPESIPVEWPRFTPVSEKYLNIGREMTVEVKLFERAHNFWFNLMPQIVNDVDKCVALSQTDSRYEFCKKDSEWSP